MISLRPLTNVHFELTFSPNIELISIVRRFVSAFYDQVLTDRDATSRLALATHELLENACKYAIDGGMTIRIDVKNERSRVQIRLVNRTSPRHLADITQRFGEMAKFSDPFAYYQMKMVETMKHKEGSGLGLARLWAEADMALSLEIDGDRVCIVADTCALAAAPAQEARS
jgi:anti-sigma regulatory factor (Ser/Thr protein kinase)